MARGGYRPGAGRKPGIKETKPRKRKKSKAPEDSKQVTPESEETKQIKAMLSFETKAKATLYNNFLTKIKAGGKLTLADKKLMDAVAVDLLAEISEEDVKSAEAESLDPLDYMLKVMNDPKAAEDRRDRMAIASAPFVHSRKGEGQGKKEDRDEKAKQAGAGKFQSGRPPLKVVK